MASLLSSPVIKDLLSPWLLPVDLVRVGATCKTAQAIISLQALWRRVYVRLWPQVSHPYVPAPKAGPVRKKLGKRERAFADVDEDITARDFGFADSDVVDWRMATCLRFAALRDNNRDGKIRKAVHACLAKSTANDLMLAHALKTVIGCEEQILRAVSCVNVKKQLKELGVDVAVVGVQYRNGSDGGQSGVCNFYVMSSVAIFFPQSALPLVFCFISCGTGYNDDPEVTGYLSCGWHDCYDWWRRIPPDAWVCSYASYLLNCVDKEALTFRALPPADSLPSGPKERCMGVRAPLSDDEEDDESGAVRFRPPQPGNSLLALEHRDRTEQISREKLGRAIEPQLLSQMYERRHGLVALSLTATGLLLCEAVRDIDHGQLSYFAQTALEQAKGFV